MTKIILLAILLSCNKMDDVFLNKILKDFDNYSYFVAIDVSSESFRGRTIIQNNDLFYYFEQTKGLNKEMYIDTMLMMFQENNPLKTENLDFEKWTFIKVRPIASITESAKKGTDEFIKAYFDGKVLKDGISDDERTAIINQLFEWKIASYIDDETGYLVVSK
jgi:hypothetical protein